MTTIDHANCESTRTSFDLLGFIRRALRLTHHALKVRGERSALHAMPDYLLKDMGIARCEIDHFTSVRCALSNTTRMDASNAR